MTSPHRATNRPLYAPSAVRRWARGEGIEIGQRGRIPAEVVERYLARFRAPASRTA
jgi:hypothetical protein